MLTFLLDKMFIRFGTKLYRQLIGIPLSINLCSRGCRFILVVLCEGLYDVSFDDEQAICLSFLTQDQDI